MLMKLKMSENMKEATAFIEQGHIRIGTEVITDPAFYVPKDMEDFVTWVDSSKIKRKIMAYNDRVSFSILLAL
jgi:U3 small nucleolar ribonucleoprotein protein IMP3